MITHFRCPKPNKQENPDTGGLDWFSGLWAISAFPSPRSKGVTWSVLLAFYHLTLVVATDHAGQGAFQTGGRSAERSTELTPKAHFEAEPATWRLQASAGVTATIAKSTSVYAPKLKCTRRP